MLSIRLDDEVETRVTAGLVRFRGLDASENNPHWPEMDQLAETLRAAHAGKAPSEIDGLEPARRLYKSFGVDPTRTRPSSEALLRRVLQGKELYRINRLVDVINWASLALLLPIGLYDLDRVEGDLEIREGRPGESYEGIRRGQINLEGRLVVADAAGPCGSPTADSLRTSVRSDTSHVIAVVFTPAGYPHLQLSEGMEKLRTQVVRWCGGQDEGAFILGGLGPDAGDEPPADGADR